MRTEAQAQHGANAQTSPFDRAVDASRAARMAALETAREMRVQARDEMRAARSHRRQAALKNARLAKFIKQCETLGIDMSSVEVPVAASAKNGATPND